MYMEEATLECVTNENEVLNSCHTDCGPFWSDDDDDDDDKK